MSKNYPRRAVREAQVYALFLNAHDDVPSPEP
jgi:hypothetical protein